MDVKVEIFTSSKCPYCDHYLPRDYDRCPQCLESTHGSYTLPMTDQDVQALTAEAATSWHLLNRYLEFGAWLNEHGRL